MKVNELRFGNLVTWADDDEIYPITVTGILDIETVFLEFMIDGEKDQTDADIEDIRPIPLTPDILLKCGFKFIDNWLGDDDREHDTCYFLDLGYTYLACGMMSDHVTLFQKDRRSTGTSCQYLHQLQNLYLSLTNQELQINL